MKTARTLLPVLPLIVTISCTDSGNRASFEKPNILFIISDDQAYHALGVLNTEVHTPHLDQLVANGTLFTHAYSQGSFAPAVCIASRAMLITGTNLWEAAMYSNSGRRVDSNTPAEMPAYVVPRNEPSGYWPEWMNDAGYDTYFAGKWHIEKNAVDLFDHTGTIRGGMPNQTEIRYNRKFIENEPDTWSPWDTAFGGFWKEGKHWSEVLWEETRDFLHISKYSSRPFFMYISFNAPHDPRQSPKEYVNMYKVSEITLPKNFLPMYPYAEEIGSGKNLRDEMLAPFPRTDYAVRKNLQEYYAIITHMDDQIGKIMEELRKTGQDKNTVVIFTSDHGLAVGDHGFMGKQNMYDASMRVPLIFAGPGIKKGQRIDEHVYFQDVVPTVLTMAKAPIPDQVDYQCLLPMMKGRKAKSAYEAVYGAYMGTQRMIRDKKYKMIIYPVANKVRLFDLENDPYEINDLASRPEYKPVMDNLFLKFKELQVEVKDPLDVTYWYESFFK